MQRKLGFLTLGILISLMANAQNDTINQTDAQGRKQGYWQKTYPNENLMYEGHFVDGKPVGEMKRYYESGNIKASMKYPETGDAVYTKFFYEDGKPAAEGVYVNNQKDSLWTYYSFYSGTITSTEMYVKGVKHGTEKKYYSNGQVSEIINWDKNVKHGPWKQYFEDGTTKLIANHAFGNVNGLYLFYWPNGNEYIKGQFVDNKRHGKWEFYKDDGTLKTEIVYQYGKAENEDKIIEENQEFFRMVDENIGKFKDPTIEDVMPGAGDYY